MPKNPALNILSASSADMNRPKVSNSSNWGRKSVAEAIAISTNRRVHVTGVTGIRRSTFAFGATYGLGIREG